MKKISVIVPNYNYERFLKARIESILNQTYPIYELIYIDDASTDNSVELVKEMTKNATFPVKIIVNEVNSGNVFKIWDKGIRIAKGDYIWIAESDDYCKSTFLEKLMLCFDDSDVILSYSQSKVIDKKGKVLHDNYLFHTKNLGNFWENDFVVDGITELERGLLVKNVIPNASAVVFKKNILLSLFENYRDEIFRFRLAGDWFVYILLSPYGKVAFLKECLNYHRNHENTNRNKISGNLEVQIITRKALEILVDNCVMDKHYLFKVNFNKYILNNYSDKIMEIDNMLSCLKKVSSYKNIAIFGLGASGKKTYNFLKEYFPKKICLFIDDKKKGYFNNIPVVPTSIFLKEYQNKIDLLIFGKYQTLNPELLEKLKINYLRLEFII